MKPYDLKQGDRFRIVQACNVNEMRGSYEVVSIQTKDITLLFSSKKFVVKIDMEVRNEYGTIAPMHIGPWVEVEKI